ncbi:MAG: ATP-binding protein [Oscillospiraceae bacterium]|nr:ATP-binding protein [Oscillospiraceae bacterium]
MDDFLYFQQCMERRRLCFGTSGALSICRFESDNGQVPQIRYARRYVELWKQMAGKNMGLLFWGAPGNGKTFAAACIANAFIESRDPFAPTVIMSTFGSILRQHLARSPQEKEQHMADLLGCGLLILDDLGMERQTEYSREQIFNIVDGRYLAHKPMIITTNLTLTQLKSPETMAEQRIYDRVLEMCVPVCFDGESLRQARAAEKMKLFRELTAEG